MSVRIVSKNYPVDIQHVSEKLDNLGSFLFRKTYHYVREHKCDVPLQR